MLKNWLKYFGIIIAGTLAVGVSNFMIFIYYYKVMIAEHLTEYWRTIHGGKMLNIIFPSYIAAALVSVSILFLVIYRIAKNKQTN